MCGSLYLGGAAAAARAALLIPISVHSSFVSCVSPDNSMTASVSVGFSTCPLTLMHTSTLEGAGWGWGGGGGEEGSWAGGGGVGGGHRK